MAERPALRTGPGRVLVFLYGLLAAAACARSAYQLAVQFDRAPFAYVLSAVAAVIYVVAFVALLRDRRRLALVAVSVELVGVLAVGTLSYVQPDDFPDATVWSGYGNGYGYLPLLMPVLALLFLRRAGRARR